MTEIHESTGAYALDALDAAELAEFEAHLLTCPTCRTEVAEFGETTAELALLTPATPPPSLRDRVLAQIATTPQLPAERRDDPAAPPSTARKDRPAPRRALGTGGDPGREPPADEVALRRQRRRTRFLTGLVAATVALALGLGGVVYALVQQRQAQVAQVTLEEQLYAAPDATTTTVALDGGGQVTFIASKQLNRALFIGTSLPDPGPDRYQLWTGTGDPTVENGITGVAPDNQVADTASGVKTFFRGNVAGANFLAVNLEPAGSTPRAPTTPVLAAGVL